MTYRTVELSSFAEYLASEDDPPEERAAQTLERAERLQHFPLSVMLKVSFAELDSTNRWCWQHFGPNDGVCNQVGSEYRVCLQAEPHTHDGKWFSHWYVKTEYNFGFNEWYFAELADQELFLAILPAIDWGENYPK
jgi:hypothetical protein